jgi:hypothetical protein
LAYHELSGDAETINTEMAKYMAVTREDLQQKVIASVTKTNSSTLIYKRESNA